LDARSYNCFPDLYATDSEIFVLCNPDLSLNITNVTGVIASVDISRGILIWKGDIPTDMKIVGVTGDALVLNVKDAS
jgi:hypothetical protein